MMSDSEQAEFEKELARRRDEFTVYASTVPNETVKVSLQAKAHTYNTVIELIKKYSHKESPMDTLFKPELTENG